MPLVRRPFTCQPQHPVMIDWSNPLTEKLRFCWNGATPINDAIIGKVTTVTGSVPSRACSSGMSPDFAGAQDFRWAKGAVGSSPTEVTLFAYAQSDNNSIDQATVVCTTYSGAANELIRIHQIPGASGWTLQSRDNVGSNLLSVNSNYPVVNGEMVFIVAVWRNLTGQKSIWVNGKKKNTSTGNTGDQTNLNQTEIGVMVRNDPTQWWDGVIPLVGMFGRALADDEIVRLSQNPYQIFKPRTIPVHTPIATAQFLRPISDVSNSGWTPSTGTNLSACIGETVRDDAVYISATAPGAIFETLLGTSDGDPASSIRPSSAHRHVGGSGGIVVRLKQGTTVIKAWTYASLTGTDTLYEPTLTSGEIDSITDYTDLRLQLETTA